MSIRRKYRWSLVPYFWRFMLFRETKMIFWAGQGILLENVYFEMLSESLTVVEKLTASKDADFSRGAEKWIWPPDKKNRQMDPGVNNRPNRVIWNPAQTQYILSKIYRRLRYSGTGVPPSFGQSFEAGLLRFAFFDVRPRRHTDPDEEPERPGCHYGNKWSLVKIEIKAIIIQILKLSDNFNKHKVTTNIPEHAHLGAFWNTRARGLGGTPQIPGLILYLIIDLVCHWAT